jgi:hypothetical protein
LRADDVRGEKVGNRIANLYRSRPLLWKFCPAFLHQRPQAIRDLERLVIIRTFRTDILVDDQRDEIHIANMAKRDVAS